MENWVQYRIYGSTFDEKVAIEMTRKYRTLHPEYIWHKESFCLQYRDGYLVGKTHIGECIEDEWFIVYLLKLLSLEYPEVVIQVQDNDGEFLLIEAADQLPAEMEPDLMENRVFLHSGKLHIIPLDIAIPGLWEAIAIVQSEQNTEVSSSLAISALMRAERYPGLMRENIHKARVRIPHRIAHLLHHCPQLIAPAIESLYTRDPYSSKSCAEMKNFPPSTAVFTTVTLTRTLFAQLFNIPFSAPAIFTMPPAEDPSFICHELGMKLACGFEILLATKLETMDQVLYQAFKKRLEKAGYFQDEMEGSQLYQKLEREAKELFFLQYEKPFWTEDLNRLMKEPLIDSSLCSSDPSDDISWMFLDDKELDSLLESKKLNLDDLDEEGSLDEEDGKELEKLTGLVEGVDQFVKKDSGVKGVLIPGQLSDDEDSDEEYLPISFDAEKYLTALQPTAAMPAPSVVEEPMLHSLENELSEIREKDFETHEGEIDVNYNLLKNLMTSFSQQDGLSGPASNLISSLGLSLPKPNVQ
jgi:predicted outer membrane lipoprotein